MTLAATPRVAGPFNGNGVTTSFPFTFKVFAATDIRVVTLTSAIETERVLNTDFTVTLNGDQEASPGGTVTYPVSGTPLPSGSTLTIAGARANTQTLDLTIGGAFDPSTIERALDSTVVLVQQLAEEQSRALTAPLSTTGVSFEVPVPEASKFIGWNDTADGLVNRDATDLASVIAYANWATDIFDGTGAQTAFTLSVDPGSVHNCDVVVDDVPKTPGVDFTVSGTTITFTAAPPIGTGNVVVRHGQALPQGTINASGTTVDLATAGAVDRLLSISLADVVNVKDFGAVGNGVVDDTAAILLAIAAAEARVLNRFTGPGSIVYFPPGTYLISSTLTIDTSNVYLVGDSPGSAMLYAPSSNFDLIHFDGSALALYSVGILNLRTYTPTNATAGCHVRVRRAINSIFHNLQCIGWYDGIISDGCAKTIYSNVILSQENRTAATTFRYGMDFASTSQNNSDVHVSDCQITWNPSDFTNATAVRIQGADGIYFANGHQQGAVLLNPSSVTCASVFWTNWYFDASPTNHVVFNGTSAAYRNFKFTNCYMRDCSADALLFNASSTITKVEVVATQFNSNGTGIRVTTAVDDMTVTACTFDDNNVGNSAANGDIIVTAGGVTVGLCRFIGGGAAGTTVALGASSADCIVTNNSMASSGPTVKITNAGSNNRIRGNTGFATKSFGQETITNPATTIVVNHGLAITPSVGQIKLTLNSASAGVTRFWPSTVTATQFTINLDATPTTTATIGWAIDGEA